MSVVLIKNDDDDDDDDFVSIYAPSRKFLGLYLRN